MRLNKHIVELGICSRRKADDLIASGKVLINGSKAQLGYQLKSGDQIEIASQKYVFNSTDSNKYYLALYKPKSYITSFEDSSKNLNELLCRENFLGSTEEYNAINKVQLHYAGRLDKESSGLLLLTNDGDLSYKLTHPKFESQKEYLVEIKKELSSQELKKLRQGVEIDPEDDGNYVMTNPCHIERVDKLKIRLILNQGYKRQIRLMLKAINNEVIELKRLRIANIALKEYEIFHQNKANKSYTNMIILDHLTESKYCLIDKPEIKDNGN